MWPGNDDSEDYRRVPRGGFFDEFLIDHIFLKLEMLFYVLKTIIVIVD